MKHLIGMTDFVLEQINPENFGSSDIVKLLKYANFLKQPPQKWMFVPCYLRNGIWIPYTKDTLLNTIDLFNEWEQAKERCLFEGFEIYDEETLRFKDIFIEYSDFFKIDVEGLEYYCSSTKLQLTPTAIKQIGL